jgi:hypothetical protein
MPIIFNDTPPVGTKIRFVNARPGWSVKDVTIRRIYVIAGIEPDGSYFFHDDVGEKNYSSITDGAGDFELVQ